MSELEIKGIKVHYRETGEGEPVLLLHGGGGSGAQWRGVCKILAPRFRTITMDHYGHGGTDPWPGAPEERTHEAEAVLVRAVMARVGEPVHLVGHSFGGGVAMRMIVQGDSMVRSLILIEPQIYSVLQHAGETAHFQQTHDLATTFIAETRAGHTEEAWRIFIDSNNPPGTWDALAEDAREKLLPLTDAIASCYHANLNHATTLAECRAITLPTLLLYGGSAFPRMRKITEIIAGEIPGSRLESIPGAGHMSPLTHPDQVAEAISGHLQGLSRDS